LLSVAEIVVDAANIYSILAEKVPDKLQIDGKVINLAKLGARRWCSQARHKL
jgi:hypothetical protein